MGDGRKRLLLTGGGTGGHLFPAIAAAEEFQLRFPGAEVMFIGTRRRLDADSLAAAGFTLRTITSFGIRGKSPLQLMRALLSLPYGFLQAVAILRKFRPDAVLAVGGYVTAPVVVAAKILRIPVVLHEQNSVPGMANRKLSRLADCVCLSLAAAEPFFAAGSTVVTGNPVRRDILRLAEDRSGDGDERRVLLILGGSQGAHSLNVLVPQALGELAKDGFTVIHQTGKKDLLAVRSAWRRAGVEAEVAPFFDDMAAVYRRASLVVSRAGATTLAELAVLGLPAVLIPYPAAADDHQLKNGEYYSSHGGAVVVEESVLSAAVLQDCVGRLLAGDTLARMGAAMRSLALPDAPRRIVDECVRLMERR